MSTTASKERTGRDGDGARGAMRAAIFEGRERIVARRSDRSRTAVPPTRSCGSR